MPLAEVVVSWISLLFLGQGFCFLVFERGKCIDPIEQAATGGYTLKVRPMLKEYVAWTLVCATGVRREQNDVLNMSWPSLCGRYKVEMSPARGKQGQSRWTSTFASSHKSVPM